MVELHHRLFFALPIHIENESLINLYNSLQEHSSNIKTVIIDNYHLTIKFLGETDDTVYRSLAESFEELDLPIKPMDYQLKGLGAFPNLHRARVLWCGLSFSNDDIKTLYKAIESFSIKFGFQHEKRGFSPHITIGRVRRNKQLDAHIMDYIESNKESSFGDGQFDKCILYESELRREGPLYKEIVVKNLK